MKAMSIVGQNESGEVKFERPLVVGKRDILLISFPDGLSDEQVDTTIHHLDKIINGQQPEGITPILGVPDWVRIRVLRINN